MQERIRLKDVPPQEVVRILEDMGEPAYRADQILDWIYEKKVLDPDEMRNLPAPLRERLKRETHTILLKMLEKQVSPADETVKYLMQTLDGELLECAVMKQDYGRTVCISSQIGCSLGCIFCASTRDGMARNVSPGEMLDQVILAEQDLREGIHNIVVMGMGEPLYNLENLLAFLKAANNPKGLGVSLRNITVSTAGIVPKILELAEERLPITLAVSLHAPDDATRSKLMPINKKYPIKDLLAACQAYAKKTGRRITFEYILAAGVNDSREQARALVRLLGGLLCHVNLIPVNPVGEEGLQRPGGERIREFQDIISQSNISVTLRKERGTDIEGACGQLRRRYCKG